MAKPTDTDLWARVRRKWRAKRIGAARPGAWSLRKLAFSRLEYRKRGGGWVK